MVDVVRKARRCLGREAKSGEAERYVGRRQRVIVLKRRHILV